MFPFMYLIVAGVVQVPSNDLQTAYLDSQVSLGVELICNVAGTLELGKALMRTQSDVDVLVTKTELAVKKFRLLPPEVQELAELSFIQQCENEAYKYSDRAIVPNPTKDGAFARLDRLEVLSVYGSRPTRIDSYHQISFQGMPSNGHLSLQVPAGRIRVASGPPYMFAGNRPWLPEDFHVAREKALAGDFLIPG